MNHKLYRGYEIKWSYDPRSYERNLCNCVGEAWKIQDFNGVWTRNLVILVRRSNQLSYEAIEVEDLFTVSKIGEYKKGIVLPLSTKEQNQTNALYRFPFTTCTNPMIHLFYPQKICIGIVFDFSWDIFMSQEKLQTMVMQKVLGGNRGVLWDCARSESEKSVYPSTAWCRRLEYEEQLYIKRDCPSHRMFCLSSS